MSKDITSAWLSKHYPFVHVTDFNIREAEIQSGSGLKIAVVEKQEPDLYFEDEPAMVLTLLKRWRLSQLARLKVIDQPWNRNQPQLDPFRTTWKKLRSQAT